MLNLNYSKPAGQITDPFPVKYFDGIMSFRQWRQLARSFPDEVAWRSLAAGHKNSLCQRDEGFNKFLAGHTVWLEFHTYLMNNFPDLCQRVFPIIVDGRQKIHFEFSSLPGDGGEVKPHPDTPKKLMTAVIFFGEDWDAGWGGAFEALRHKTRPDDDWTDKRCPWDEVTTMFSVPVKPMRMLFMLRTNNSLHGVRPIKAAVPRRTVTVNLIARGELDHEAEY